MQSRNWRIPGEKNDPEMFGKSGLLRKFPERAALIQELGKVYIPLVKAPSRYHTRIEKSITDPSYASFYLRAE